MNLDKPLDEIIKSNPKARRGARGGSRRGSSTRRASGAKAAALGSNAAQNAAQIAAQNRQRPPVVIPGRTSAGNFPGKIIVSNLPLDVNEAQIKDLFASSIGPLRKVTMSYRANGQSTGTCTVEFQRGPDAEKAYKQYNNRIIDGKNSMRVEVVVDPSRTAAAAIAAQPRGAVVAPVAAAAAARRQRGGAAGGRGGRGGPRRGGGAGGREKRPKKSLEDLDAEMEDYATKATDTATTS